MKNKKEISVFRAATIFGVATGYFYVLLITLFPFLRENFRFNPSLYWFFTGYFLFIPLFIYSIFMVRYEGNRSILELFEALNLRRLTKSDLFYTIIGAILIFIFTGIIYGCSFLLNKHYGLRLLNTTPWFMEEMIPYQGIEKLLLFVWFPMFFFNIVGEEILWRGYIQNRMKSKYAWIACSLLWLIFHLPFGIDLIIMALPALLIIPYVFYKKNNTLISIVIHGVYNGPIFILISLGLIK